MGVDLDHGPAYGNTLTWDITKSDITENDIAKNDITENHRPSAQPVQIQLDLDTEMFYRMFVALMTAPTPAH
jgi:hypothetical protein